MNKRELQKEQTRKQLLEVSLELFAKNGYNGTSMDMIAKKAKVSKGLAYSHFKNKNALLFELVKHFGDKRRKNCENILNSEISPKEKMRLLISFSLEFINNRKDLNHFRLLYSVILQLGNLEILKPYLLKLKQEFIGEKQTVKTLLLSLGVKDTELELHYLRTVLHGITIQCLHNEKSYPLQEMLKIVMDRYNL